MGQKFFIFWHVPLERAPGLNLISGNNKDLGLITAMDSLNRHEDYGQESLEEGHLLDDPIAQFKSWLLDAEAAEIYEPNAFVLGTVDSENQPRSDNLLNKLSRIQNQTTIPWILF